MLPEHVVDVSTQCAVSVPAVTGFSLAQDMCGVTYLMCVIIVLVITTITITTTKLLPQLPPLPAP
jgi:hypothetical protein